MSTLIIETSSKKGFIILASETKIMEIAIIETGKELSNQLVPAIGHMLAKKKLKCKDLKQVAAGIGPGSYTGARVAVTIAKGITFASQIPLICFSSYRAMDLPKPGNFAIISPVRQENIFLVKGKKENGKVTFYEEGYKPFHEAAADLKNIENIYCPYKDNFPKDSDLFPRLTECLITPLSLFTAAMTTGPSFSNIHLIY